MKATFKTFALLCMGLFATACIEENFEPNRIDTTPGNDIQFSATAHVGNGNMQTRTEYGDVNDNKNLIEVNWTAGDKITIASPEASGATMAHYDIGFVADAEGYSGSHAATVTKRGGAAGLQWSESDTYTFYASYPMLDKGDADKDFNGTSSLELTDNGAVLKGYLPVAQAPKNISSAANNYVVEPDMRYAYMVAHDTYDRSAKDSEGNNTDKISLPFQSLSTVLQFQLKAGTITNQNVNEIKVTSVSIYSVTGKPICGPFKYTYSSTVGQLGQSEFDTEAAKENNATQASYSRITMDFASMEQNVILTTGNTLDLTFFLLPIVNFDDANKDLKLQIFYEVNGSQQFMEATLNVDITASRKYFFKNLAMKNIDTKVEGSKWMSALAENIYISQLSIPVAGNAFASYYDDGDADNDSEKYYREQVLDYKTLWNMGVRGFEFCNSVTKSTSTSATLDTEPFVCNGQALNVQDENGQSITFGNALRYLESMLDMYPNEALFIIATYKSFSGDLGYYPDVYLRQLDNFINANDDIKDRLVKLNPNSTVEDLKGKIAILIRLKDEDYDARVSQVNSALGNMTYLSQMTYIQDWGTAVDCWDRRFGSGYKRQMAYSGGSGTEVEYYLGAVSSSKTTFNTDYKNFVEGYPTSQEATDANYNLRSYGATADDIYLQEWARVVPKEFADQSLKTPLSTGVQGFYDGIFDRYLGYLWTRWYDSSIEKVNMVNAALSSTLATKGATNSGKLYFNSLAGYYVTDELPESYLPYTGGNFTITSGYYTYKFDTVRPGAGGDYAGLAADLNVHFYDEFKKIEGTDKQGPLGFVILDYIGASEDDFMKSKYLVDNTSKTHASIADAVEASSKLPNMILMNNFKFPLATKDSSGSSTVTYNASYVDGGEAISFE